MIVRIPAAILLNGRNNGLAHNSFLIHNSEDMNILVSACLLGFNVRYDGDNNERFLDKEKLEKLQKLVTLIPFCPEVYGGLSTPRLPCEKSDGRIVNTVGEDKTEFFEKGADQALKAFSKFNCRFALLKERSPSCGSDEIYDGTFSHTVTEGDGITAALLKSNGVKVFGESRLDELIEAIKIAKSPQQLTFNFYQ